MQLGGKNVFGSVKFEKKFLLAGHKVDFIAREKH